MTVSSLKTDFNDPSLHNDFVVQAGGHDTKRWYWKSLDVEQFLKEHPEAAQWKDWEGRTALISAITTGHIENARLLLEAGANPNAEDRQGRTALNIAVTDINDWTPALVELLIDNGATVDSQNKKGQTPLMMAVQNKNLTYATPTIEKLLQRGADPGHKDAAGKSALDFVQAQYDAISVKNPTSFIPATRIGPVLDLLKYWSELRKLSQDIKPQKPAPKP